MILDPWSSILDPRSLILDPWSLILDPWSLMLDPWSLILDPRSSILDPWSGFSRKPFELEMLIFDGRNPYISEGNRPQNSTQGIQHHKEQGEGSIFFHFRIKYFFYLTDSHKIGVQFKSVPLSAGNKVIEPERKRKWSKTKLTDYYNIWWKLKGQLRDICDYFSTNGNCSIYG